MLQPLEHSPKLERMVQGDGTIDLHDLRALVSVVRCGGITAAAQTLGMAKSTVSTQITRLEKRLGVRVMERSSRRIVLTREGEQLLPRVQSLLAEADQLLDDASRARMSPHGTVRMTVTPPLGGVVLERLVPALAARYPDIALIVKSSYDVEDVQDPAFDFAVRVGQVGDDGLVAHPVGSFARIFVSAPTSVVIPSEVSMLGAAPLLAFSGTSTHIDWRLVRSDGSGQDIVLNCEAKASARDFELLLRLVRAGRGITMVPEFMVREDLAAGRLLQVLPQWRSPPIQVLIAYRVGASRVRRIAAVLEEVERAVVGVLHPIDRSVDITA